MSTENNHDHDSQNKENNEQNPHSQGSAEGNSSDEKPIVETFYADDDHHAHHSEHADDWDEPKNFGRTMCDSILRKIPYNVLHHLNNSQKELVKAWIAFGEDQLERSEKRMQRAREVHNKT